MFLRDLSWPAIERLSKDMPVIVPIAAVEQHGRHLPLYTDSYLLGEIVRRVEAERSDRCLVTPLMWLGNSHHHLDFPGTMSCAPRDYLNLLVGLLNNLITHGFRRILLLNGHGGNDVPSKQATFEVRQQHRERGDLLLLFSTYWSLGGRPWESMDGFQQHEMGHACEWETSMMMRIAPNLVGDYRDVPVVEPGNPFLPATRGWITKDRSTIGHIGWPHLASVEKGEHLLVSFSQDIEQLLQRIEEWDGKSWEG